MRTAIRNDTDIIWTITTNQGEFNADVLIMADGNNDNSNPIIPQLPNRELYRGKVLHSSQVGDGSDLLEAERIVVIGGTKSAYDCGQFHPDKTTLIMRTPHYWYPRWILCLPFFDRIANYLFRGYRVNCQDRTLLLRLLDEVLMPMFAVGINKPTSGSLLDDIMTGGGINVCTTNQQYANANKWNLVRSSPVAYTSNGLELSNGEIVQADAVVWGTGFEPTTFFQKVFSLGF